MTAPACEVWFYHLEGARLEQILPELLEKTLARGWRAVVRASSGERIEQLDGWLWSYRDDGFLAHGPADEPLAERQPIVLTSQEGNPNGAKALFLIDGAPSGSLSGFDRCLVIFDGSDEEAVAAARAAWTGFSADGLAVSYWRQNAARGWRKEA